MADGLRRVASAYYERASEDEQDEAKHFFKTLDVNEDGEISLEEFKSGYDSAPSAEDFFNKLDSNGDGALDFEDALVLFYHKKKVISISRCDGCNQKLFGSYFSCVLCLDYFPNTYDLCCDCHREGKSKHHHPSRFMLHDQAALVKFIHSKTPPPKVMERSSSESPSEQNTPLSSTHSTTKSEMEELGEIAKALYGASSPEIQGLAKDFFNSMDSDGDGKVSLEEFTSFMSNKGYKLTGNPNFFKKLVDDGNENLDFWEVMRVYYIIKSGRPFCDCCGEFIPATYFSCVKCGSFDLCRRCLQLNKYDHSHNGGPAQFLDVCCRAKRVVPQLLLKEKYRPKLNSHSEHWNSPLKSPAAFAPSCKLRSVSFVICRFFLLLIAIICN